MSENIKHTRLEDAEAEIQRLRAKLKTLEAVERHDAMRNDPIAIVGMGCRFPGGVDSPEAFWELLISGKDILGGIPESRWDVDAFYDAE
ncbi:MAG: beta-ketoacyl synthase N-terminal-like domain-containing protein, partial [Rhodospirillaceae bacterium]